MTGFAWCLILASFAAPQTESVTLNGEEQGGELIGLTAESLLLKSGDGEVKVPVGELLEVRLPSSGQASLTQPAPPVAGLVDGSWFSFSAVSSTARDISFETPRLGKIAFPLPMVANLRFAAGDSKIDEAWKELCTREIKSDLLVIRKEDVLDHLDGTIGAIEGETIHFVIDGEDVPVKREKVFGIIYAGRSVPNIKASCELTTAGAEQLRLRDIVWKEGAFHGTFATGTPVVLASENVRSLDFSLGKLRYLSQMEPREVKYTPYFDTIWKYHRDRNREGEPLRLANKVYARGLWIHSRTFLRYRIAGDYRRFRAVMGIDQGVAPRGDIHIVIQGDGKTLLESDIKGADAPQPIDLDVAGVRDLDILVDFGNDLDIADHLDLCDARVIK